LVDDGHVPAFLVELQGDRRTDAATADDQCPQVHDLRNVARYTSSSTPCGKATTSTSADALRRTYSTVGEKKRDCRRQRGDEPSTIRSAPVSSAAFTTASPMFLARMERPSTSTPRSAPRAAASASDAAARSSSSNISASSGWSSGTRITFSATTAAPRSCASLTAVATISSPISPSFI